MIIVPIKISFLQNNWICITAFFNKRLILFAIFLFLLFPSIANADGLFIPHENEDISQPSQKAIILFDNNTEQLIIQSKYEGNIVVPHK